jgi:hypothetical protein
LKKSYEAWLREVEGIAAGEAGSAGPAGADPPPRAPAPPAREPAPSAGPTRRAAQPAAPVRRHIETARGQAYEVEIEQIVENWYLTIRQMPRQPGVDAPDLQKVFPSYEEANAALRQFIRGH